MTLRIPKATDRLQFNSGFTFDAARGIAAYLHELGISDVYASPILKARKGSAHGYDVVDAGALNPELGTEEDFGTLDGEGSWTNTFTGEKVEGKRLRLSEIFASFPVAILEREGD